MPNSERRFSPSFLTEERLILTILDCLDGFERNVMEYRVGFGTKSLTYEEIGQLTGYTAEHIRATEEQALRRIVLACTHARRDAMKPDWKIKLGDLALDSRAENVLKSNGIFYAEQLCLYSTADLLAIPGMGKVAVENIRKVLRENNMILKPVMGPKVGRPKKPENVDAEPKTES